VSTCLSEIIVPEHIPLSALNRTTALYGGFDRSCSGTGNRLSLSILGSAKIQAFGKRPKYRVKTHKSQKGFGDRRICRKFVNPEMIIWSASKSKKTKRWICFIEP